MKLITEIIKSLTSSNNNIVDALLQTKVIASKLKNQELFDWVNNEINGYKKVKDLPEYRIIGANVIGTISDGYRTQSNSPLPLLRLDEEIRKRLTTIKMAHSIAALQTLVNTNDSDLSFNIPPEMFSVLSESLLNAEVIYAKQQTNITQVVQIITTVRSKLLDFMLALDNEIQEGTEDIGKDKEIIEKATDLFNSTIFGDNTTIIIGSGNTQSVKNKNIKKGNFNSLEKALKESEVPEEDINELKSIIDNDNTNQSERKFGDKVNAWIMKLLGKSVDTTWKVGIGVAGKLLADAIQHYYGWHH